MNRPLLKLATLVIVVYLVTLVALFPARLAVRWFVPPVPGLVLGPAGGTVWDGQIVGVEYAEWKPAGASWEVDPLALLTLALNADARIERSNKAPIRLNLAAGVDGRITVADLNGTVAISEFEQARVMPRNFGSGQILLNISRLEFFEQRPTAAEGRIGLTDLQSPLLPGVPLGSYEAELTTTDDAITGSFRDVEAPLRVAGQVKLLPDGSYTVTGTMTPNSDTPEQLRRGLALLGRPDNSGRYSFSFNGQL